MTKITDFITVPELAKKLGITRQAARLSVVRYGIQFTWIGRMCVLAPEDQKELMRLRAANPLSRAQRKRRSRERVRG